MALGNNLKKTFVSAQESRVDTKPLAKKLEEINTPAVVVAEEGSKKKNMIVVFELEGEFFGLPVEFAKEVVKAGRVSSVPQSQPYILGVSNIRGEVLAILDLRLLLGLDQSSKPAYPNLLVIKSNNRKMALGIHEVPKTWKIEEADVQSTVNMTWSDEDNQFIKGLLKRGDQMIMILNPEKIFESNRS